MKSPPPRDGLTRRDLLRYGAIGATGIVLAPCLNLINPSKAFATTPQKIDPNTLVDNKYDWYLSFTDTQIENNGCSHPLTLQSEILTRDNYRARNVYGHRFYAASDLWMINGVGVRWTGGKYIDGTPVDMVGTVYGYKPNWRTSDGPGKDYNYFYCTTVGELNPYHEQLRTGINKGAPLIEFCGFEYLDLRFNFYKTGTNEPIKLSGHTTLSDCDWGERVKFDKADYVYISKNNNGIWINNDDSFQAISGEQANLENSTASIYFNCEEFTMRYYGSPWKLGLCCLDNSSLVTITPPDPTKTYSIH